MLAFADRAYHVVDLAFTGPVEADVDVAGVPARSAQCRCSGPT
jgi:hypothetical protein